MAEPHHGAAFHELLEKVMPDWERQKQRLERALA
ncbi:YgjP-like metallopeptidase domain-containing protein [Nitratireductor mangrovi]|nr:YgjP-like metallopeptidase domain-containing protein [Nitratireductor mangrovi]